MEASHTSPAPKLTPRVYGFVPRTCILREAFPPFSSNETWSLIDVALNLKAVYLTFIALSHFTSLSKHTCLRHQSLLSGPNYSHVQALISRPLVPLLSTCLLLCVPQICLFTRHKSFLSSSRMFIAISYCLSLYKNYFFLHLCSHEFFSTLVL